MESTRRDFSERENLWFDTALITKIKKKKITKIKKSELENYERKYFNTPNDNPHINDNSPKPKYSIAKLKTSEAYKNKLNSEQKKRAVFLLEYINNKELNISEIDAWYGLYGISPRIIHPDYGGTKKWECGEDAFKNEFKKLDKKLGIDSYQYHYNILNNKKISTNK